LGSIRHAGVSCGRDVTTTLPRKSVRWSSVLAAKLSTCLPSALPPIRSPSAPPIPPTTLPAVAPIWPVMRTLPLSGVMIDSVFDCPLTDIVPRVTVRPISAWRSSCVTGLSFFPANSRGVSASTARAMAVSATATGATTRDVCVTGCKAGGGCMIAIASGNPLSSGASRLKATRAANKPIATMQAPPTARRNLRERPKSRIGAVA
jgi:hypothetical protein